MTRCLLCGQPCETFESILGTIRVCPCVPEYPGMVAVDMSLAMEGYAAMDLNASASFRNARPPDWAELRAQRHRERLANHDPGDEHP